MTDGPTDAGGEDAPIGAGTGTGTGTDADRCDYCRLTIDAPAARLERDGVVYEFCSRRCREAHEESDHVFTEYHAARRYELGLSVLEPALPQGVPRNSAVLVSGHAGTRGRGVLTELVWRTLERGEPVVVVSFLEPPVSVVQTFVTLDWNVLPHLEAGRLHVLDCFTYRHEDRDRLYDRMGAWNRHLQGFVEPATTTVRDPSDVRQLASQLDGALEDLGMGESGIVVVDSLTEFGTLVQPVQAYNFVKDVRAEVCKGRFVPLFAGATIQEGTEFPHDLEYMFDGLLELQLSDDLTEHGLVKRIRVRKMGDVVSVPRWFPYEFTPGRGVTPLSLDDGGDVEDKSGGETAERDMDEHPDGDDRAEDASGATDGSPHRGEGDTSRTAGASGAGDDGDAGGTADG